MKKIGVISVDTGQIVISDPVYFRDLPSYEKISKGTIARPTVQLKNKRGIKIAIASRTGLGDGTYPVYAVEGYLAGKKFGKRVKKLIIDFAPKNLKRVI